MLRRSGRTRRVHHSWPGSAFRMADHLRVSAEPRSKESIHRSRGSNVLAVVGYATALAVVALVAHYRYGSGNPDFTYYQLLGVQLAGGSIPDAITAVAMANGGTYTDYLPLEYGLLSPDIAPLIYARYLIAKLLAVAYSWLGITGLVWIPAVLGVLLLLLLIWLVAVKFGWRAAAALPFTALATRLYFDYAFAPYTELLVLFWLVAVLPLLPVDGARSRWTLATFMALTLLLALTRQIPQLPVLLVGAGWVGAWVITRRWRNPWLSYLIVATGTAAVAYGLVARWAPYDASQFVANYYGLGQDNIWLWRVGHAGDSILDTIGYMWARDLPAFGVVGLAFVGAFLERRTAWPWLWAGTAAAGFTTLVMNRPDYRFWAPALVVGLMLAARGLAFVAQWLWNHRGVLAPLLRTTPPADLERPSIEPPPSPAVTAPANRRTRQDRRWAVAAWVLVLLVGLSFVLDFAHPAADLTRPVADVVPADQMRSIGTDQQSVVSCSHREAQVWLTEPDGTEYPITGTAAKTLLGQPTPGRRQVIGDGRGRWAGVRAARIRVLLRGVSSQLICLAAG